MDSPISREANRLPLFITAALCGLTLALCLFASAIVVIGFLCLMASVIIGLLLSTRAMLHSSSEQPKLLQTLLELAADTELAILHESLAQSLRRIADQPDVIFRRLAISRLETIASDCRLLGNATVQFSTTESWRVVYEELLRSPGLHLYRSVAYIETAHYWQDGPGQQSTQLNLELHDADIINIERIAIVADHLWPENELFPVEPLHSWLEQQHRYGISVRLLRESLLENDIDLLCDFGIYGSRAVGIQHADPAGRTVRFVLDFNFTKVQQAEATWSRLGIYATPYRDLLEQQH